MSDPELLAVVRQAQRYDIAAAQDRSPVIASLHLAYARQAMEFALEAGRERVRRVAKIDPAPFLARVRAFQDRVQHHLLKVVAACPVAGKAWV